MMNEKKGGDGDGRETERGVRGITLIPGVPTVLKAQVLAGGRGKGHFDNGFQGGVQMVDS
jgi:succinyl-CoA synthetase beta subunit